MRLVLFFTVCCKCLTFAQSFPCYPAPEINFTGTSVAMHYLVEDTLFPQDFCFGVVPLYQQHDFIVPIVETENSYIGIFSNGNSGVVLNAWDLQTDTLLWRRNFNHVNTNLGRAYGITRAKWGGGDTLYVKGHRSWDKYTGSQFPSARYRGLISDRKISVADGAIFSDSFKGEDYHIYANQAAYNNMDDPHTVRGTNIYHTMSFFSPSFDSVSIKGHSSYVDSLTHRRYLNFEPYYEYPPQGGADDILIYEFGPKGEKAENVIQYGPMQVTDSTKTYLLRYKFSATKNHLAIVEIDNWGNFISFNNVTDALSKDIDRFIWNNSTVDRINDNLYKIDGYLPSDNPELWSKGEKRYILMDGYGNLVKERSYLEFDGMLPMLWRSKVLNNGNILHVFRPTENNNLYLYEEYEDGSYRKAGELVNESDPFYAYEPRQIDQLSNGDVFIKNNIVVDTVWQLFGEDQNFNIGGWGVMLKINAEDLGLQVSTEEPAIGTSDVIVYPNPATEDIRLDIDADQYPIDVEVYDILGRSIYTDKLYYQSESIPVRSWGSGIYQIRVRSRDGVLSLGKFYKE